MICYNPQDESPQYLEDLATGYWLSEALFTAVELDIFSLLDPDGRTITEISDAAAIRPEALERFLNALAAMRLVVRSGQHVYNTRISEEYLVAGKRDYQGASILWRRELASHWKGLNECLKTGGRTQCSPDNENEAGRRQRIRKYMDAMDCVAKTKVKEMLPFFDGLKLEGKLLDIGAGSGAVTEGFLRRFGALNAMLVDIPEVLDYTKELMHERGLENRTTFCAFNILEEWPEDLPQSDLVILSNIIHAYSGLELQHILGSAAACLKPDGILLIHDFFLGHYPVKTALFDLNMFVNTYNGRLFSSEDVIDELQKMGLRTTGFIGLNSDTGVVAASQNAERLSQLALDPKERLSQSLKGLGFPGVHNIPTESIHIPGWTIMRCRFGCEHYGSPHCPPHAPSSQETKAFISDYSHALLLEGEPPTRDFQLRVLEAEREAFRAGYYKAFAYWAGPCSLCPACTTDGSCRSRKDARPSMEGSGIDVFETVKRAGLNLRTLDNRSGFVKYFALLLLE